MVNYQEGRPCKECQARYSVRPQTSVGNTLARVVAMKMKRKALRIQKLGQSGRYTLVVDYFDSVFLIPCVPF